MSIYSISYDISEKSKSNYESVEEIILNNCQKSCKYATTTWIVSYNGSADELANKIIKTGFSNDDKLLVIEVTNNKQGWLLQTQWDTINSIF